MPDKFDLTINGRDVAIETDEDRPLLDVLREDLGLTGAKYGCGEGECGACTVLMEGSPVRSCITTVADAAGMKIETIESLANGAELHAMQQAFLDHGAMQCGYCIPGQIMNAVGLHRENPHPSREEIVDAMTGNICRCCNYSNLLAAIEAASK